MRELAQGGAAVAAAVETGGNGVRVGDIRLEVGDPDAVLEQARDAAVEEATAKAEQYAAATGQALGDVLGSARSARQPRRARSRRPAELRAARRLGRPATMPIRAGEEDADGHRSRWSGRSRSATSGAARAADRLGGWRPADGRPPRHPLRRRRLNTRAWQRRTT